MIVGVFAMVLLCIGILTLLHHGWIHSIGSDENRKAQAESCACACYFQPSDVSHYEVWIFTCFTNALCLSLGIVLTSLQPALLGFYIATIGLCAIGIILVLFYCRTDRKDAVHNVSNHEIWIVLCFTNALSLILVEFSLSI
jgi:hypothetical protein